MWSASGRVRWSVDGFDITKTMPKRDAKLCTAHPCHTTRPPISSQAPNALLFSSEPLALHVHG